MVCAAAIKHTWLSAQQIHQQTQWRGTVWWPGVLFLVTMQISARLFLQNLDVTQLLKDKDNPIFLLHGGKPQASPSFMVQCGSRFSERLWSEASDTRVQQSGSAEPTAQFKTTKRSGVTEPVQAT